MRNMYVSYLNGEGGCVVCIDISCVFVIYMYIAMYHIYVGMLLSMLLRFC